MMSAIDFSKKISFQRPFSQPISAEDEYAVIRQFESDRGRIVNSAAIRRLQQKTQVFPLERNAAVRSRLTHSMEVQQVGRHIVKEIFHQLKREQRIAALGLTLFEAPCESMVEMACLMHDIGNPPFGHFGEAAINDWFRQRLDIASLDGDAALGNDRCRVALLRLRAGEDEDNALRSRIRLDLCHFEGNAQAIRMVHSLLKLNLTYAQVGCILKYTRPAYWQGEVPASFSYLMKKPGYYLAEEEYVKTLRDHLALGEFHRFPLTYIMEAADDISYCIADLEDAVEKKIFTAEQLYNYLRQEWGNVEKGDLFERVVGQAFEKVMRNQGSRSGDQFFMYLRVNTVARLVPHAAQRFLENLAPIFEGYFNQALLEGSGPAHRLLKIFKAVAFKHVFNYPEVEQLELQGYRVISGLLEIYNPLLEMPAEHFSELVARDYHPAYMIATRLFHKLSVKHRLAYSEAVAQLHRYPQRQRSIMEFYYRARLIQDYISGMTDLYAWDEYRRLMAAE